MSCVPWTVGSGHGGAVPLQNCGERINRSRVDAGRGKPRPYNLGSRLRADMGQRAAPLQHRADGQIGSSDGCNHAVLTHDCGNGAW